MPETRNVYTDDCTSEIEAFGKDMWNVHLQSVYICLLYFISTYRHIITINHILYIHIYITRGPCDKSPRMATWEPTAVAGAASTGGHWWGPLDGPPPAGRPAEAEQLRGQMHRVVVSTGRWGTDHILLKYILKYLSQL